MDGTMQYCADLGVDPSEVIMLALAWFTKAPTMGRFSKREWVEAWQAIGSVFPPFPFFFPWIYCHWCKELRADSDGLCRRTGRIRWSDKRSRSTSFGNNSRRQRRSEKSTSLRSTMPRPKGKRACVRRFGARFLMSGRVCGADEKGGATLDRIRDRARAVEPPDPARPGFVVPARTPRDVDQLPDREGRPRRLERLVEPGAPAFPSSQALLWHVPSLSSDPFLICIVAVFGLYTDDRPGIQAIRRGRCVVPFPPAETPQETDLFFFDGKTAAWPSVIDDFVEYARARI